MADYNGFSVTFPSLRFTEQKYLKFAGDRKGEQVPSVRTYYYRSSNGTYGSTTTLGSVPIGASIIYQLVS